LAADEIILKLNFIIIWSKQSRY